MGNKTSTSQLEAEGFSKSEIARLSKRFKKLDTDG
jgi:Ca2+-binding EF-hand superfamily protein